jgi:hypothetical protein
MLYHNKKARHKKNIWYDSMYIKIQKEPQLAFGARNQVISDIFVKVVGD